MSYDTKFLIVIRNITEDPLRDFRRNDFSPNLSNRPWT